jgi:hypothetical protein
VPLVDKTKFIPKNLRDGWLSTFCGSCVSRFLHDWRRQEAGDALIQFEEEDHALSIRGVGFFAAAGLVGGVYGGVEFLVGFEQGRGHGQRVVEVGQ